MRYKRVSVRRERRKKNTHTQEEKYTRQYVRQRRKKGERLVARGTADILLSPPPPPARGACVCVLAALFPSSFLPPIGDRCRGLTTPWRGACVTHATHAPSSRAVTIVPLCRPRARASSCHTACQVDMIYRSKIIDVQTRILPATSVLERNRTE